MVFLMWFDRELYAYEYTHFAINTFDYSRVNKNMHVTITSDIYTHMHMDVQNIVDGDELTLPAIHSLSQFLNFAETVVS